MTRRRRTERGTALIEVTWLSILLLVPLVYVVLAVFDVQRSAFAVNAATRAAGRAYSLAPSDEQGSARARAAAAVALRDQGLDLSDGSLVAVLRAGPADCLSPGSVVHVRMAVPGSPAPDAGRARRGGAEHPGRGRAPGALRQLPGAPA